MKILYKNYVSYPVIQLCLPAHLPIFLKLQLASASTSSASAGSVQRPFLGFEISIGSDDSKILRFLRFPDSLMRSTRALGIFFAPLLPSSSFVVESKSNKFHQYLLFVT